MKKARFLLVFILLFAMAELKAQYHYVDPPDSSQYDLLYVFDTSFVENCFSTDDTLIFIFPTAYLTSGNNFSYSYPYSKFGWYNALKRQYCDPDAPMPDGDVVGANCYRDSNDNLVHYAEAFAQEYHLEIPYNDYVICGVAIKLSISALDDYRNLCVLNDQFDTISSTIFHTTNPMSPDGLTTYHWNRGGWNTYYFPSRDYDSLTNINDFKIAFDVPMFGYGNTFQVFHTCNVYSPCMRDSIMAHGGPFETGYNYDTIFWGVLDHYCSPYPGLRDTINNTWHTEYALWNYYQNALKQDSTAIPLCSYPDPKYLKHNGEWRSFDEDPAYDIWQHIRIAMVPIIMIPVETSGGGQGALSEVELQKMCYVYPNPAKDYVKVLSHFDIRTVQLVDISGRVVREQIVNTFEGVIDTRGLSSGTYIVKINTVKGSVEEKLIIQ